MRFGKSKWRGDLALGVGCLVEYGLGRAGDEYGWMDNVMNAYDVSILCSLQVILLNIDTQGSGTCLFLLRHDRYSFCLFHSLFSKDHDYPIDHSAFIHKSHL
jgi:hypothetical protein